MAVDFSEKAKRYQAIDEIIASGRKLKWKEIIQELQDKYEIHTSRTSFFRDIEELQKKYSAPIDTDFETSGYFYTDPDYRLPHLYTDENAAKAARLIKTLMDMVKDNPLYKEAQEVFESLAIENHDLSIENIKINKKPENDRIIFVGAPNKDIPAETWRIIDKALQENRTGDYLGAASASLQEGAVPPGGEEGTREHLEGILPVVENVSEQASGRREALKQEILELEKKHSGHRPSP